MRWAVLEPFVALKSSNLLNFKAIGCKFVGWQCCPQAKMLPKGKVSHPTGSHLRHHSSRRRRQQPWHSFEEFDNCKRPSRECGQRRGCAVRERSCKRKTVHKGDYYRSQGKKFMPVDPWADILVRKKWFDAPTRRSSPSQLCRDPMVEMLAKIGRRVKISLQSPTFAPQRTCTVKDKRSTQSMGYEPSQPCFWTCIIDRSFFIYNPGIFL